MASDNQYSAGEQALGYIYQPRLALLRLLQLPEDISVLIEKDDDLEFMDCNGEKSLASLKHKAPGDRLTDLSLDFWKSLRIWLVRYRRDGKVMSKLRFFMFTTSEVANGSFLADFLPTAQFDPNVVLKSAEEALSQTKSEAIIKIKKEFMELNEEEKKDFLERVVIFDKSPRIEDVPDIIINQYMRTVRSEFRRPVFERLEGWWNILLVDLLTGRRTTEIFGQEISDKLSSIVDEYKYDNLPITFRGEKPDGEIDPESDDRLFVIQLREIGISPSRIQKAIYDYYRAFEQRSSWARENVLFEGEVEEYEDRLVDEWERYRDVVFESIEEGEAEKLMLEAGKGLYNWAEMNTDYLRIRERVTEPYVVRGNFHILANEHPKPRVYWHPRFLERIDKLLAGGA